MGRVQTGIYTSRPRLTPNQVRAVARLRLQDAACLHQTGLPRHATGIVYLCGLVVDCLLKAKLLDKYPVLRLADPSTLDPDQRRRWQLVYRSHDLDEMLESLPEITKKLARAEGGSSSRLVLALKSVCVGWTIKARYNTQPLRSADVDQMFAAVKELRPWLE